MKIRNGFVSNSSSSSFILIFNKKPESKEEFAELMGECSVSGYEDDDNMSSEMVIDIAYNDVVSAGEASDEDIRSELRNHYYEWTPRNLKWNTPEYDEWHKKSDERVAVKIEQFLKTHTSKYMTIISYEDATIIGSMMEHQGAFDNLHHIRVSHH